jgi:hypothetical protein
LRGSGGEDAGIGKEVEIYLAYRRKWIGGDNVEFRLGRGRDGHEGVHTVEDGSPVRATADDHARAEVDVRGVVGEGY